MNFTTIFLTSVARCSQWL